MIFLIVRPFPLAMKDLLSQRSATTVPDTNRAISRQTKQNLRRNPPHAGDIPQRVYLSGFLVREAAENENRPALQRWVREIDVKRLRANPAARLCVPCQSSAEPELAVHTI